MKQHFIFFLILFLWPALAWTSSLTPAFSCQALTSNDAIADASVASFKENCNHLIRIQSLIHHKKTKLALTEIQKLQLSAPNTPQRILDYLVFHAHLTDTSSTQTKNTLKTILSSDAPTYFKDFIKNTFNQHQPGSTTPAPKRIPSLKSKPLELAQWLSNSHLSFSPQKKKKYCQRLLIRAPHIPQVQELENNNICLVETLNATQRLKRVQKLLKGSYPKKAALEAQALVKQLQDMTAPQQQELNLLLIETLVRSDRAHEAIAYAKTLSERHPTQGHYWGKYAWATAKAGQLLQAVELRKKQHRHSSAKDQKEDGCFFAGFGLYENNRYSEANAYWKTCFDEFENGSWRNALRWYIPFSHLLINQPQKAIHFWNLEIDSIQKELLKHRFFMGIAYEQMSDLSGAKKHFKWVAKNAPLNYYGIRAREKLQWAPIKGQRHEAQALQKQQDQAIAQLTLTQKYFLVLGEKDLLRKSITKVQEKKNRAAFYGLYQTLGDYHHPWRHAGKIASKQRIKTSQIRLLPSWRASYALPHLELVQKAAQPTNIDPAMVYAIMRTESGFHQRAVSPVGALGLMQLMPYTAAYVAQTLKQPQPSREQLLAPQASIYLGTHFLNILKKSFTNDFLVAAAYNGSPKSVSNWLQTFGDLPTVLFVERIPYKETRQYVKKVIATKAIYKGLNGEALQMNFPDKPPVLKNLIPVIQTLDTQLD